MDADLGTVPMHVRPAKNMVPAMIDAYQLAILHAAIDAQGRVFVCGHKPERDAIGLLAQGYLSRDGEYDNGQMYRITNKGRGAITRRSLAPYGACRQCDEIKNMSIAMAPPHDPSSRCESGHHLHCSCDTCF